MKLLREEIIHERGELCPSCCSTDVVKKKGGLEIRRGKFGLFLGCSRFPDCRYTCKVGNLEKETRKLLGRKTRRSRRRL